MNPHFHFNLHDRPPRDLLGQPAVYRLVHADEHFHVSSTKLGRRRLSPILRIGHTVDAHRRANDYRSGRSGRPALDAFIDAHRGRIIVEGELVDPRYLRIREAELMADHANKKGRIPRYNTRGEFDTVCRHLNRCFTRELKREYTQGWVEDAEGYQHRLQGKGTRHRLWP